MAWFNYNGGSPTSTGSYTSISGEPGCLEGEHLCSINAGSGTAPNITPALISEMLNAVVLQTSSDNVRLKD